MTRLNDFTCALLLLLFASALVNMPSWAADYPWVQIHDSDIEVVPSIRVEAAIRIELIRRAKHTIDIVTYDQRTDLSIGLPLLKALREAADRGVHIRFLTTWITQFVGNRKDWVPKFLTYPPTREPIEVMVFGGFSGYQRGWALDDNIHNKLFIVDAEVLLTTGRGQSDFYLDWLDTGFLIKGALLKQSTQAFETLWQTCLQETRIFRTNNTAPVLVQEQDRRPTLSVSEAKQLAHLSSWLHEPPAMHVLENGTARARLLHHDLIHQLRSLPGKPRSYRHERRIQMLSDPIIEAIVEKMDAAHRVEFTTMSVILHPKLKAAILRALARNVPVNILVNDRSVFHVVSPIAAPWYVGLPDLEEILLHGAQVYIFKQNAMQPYTFLHRKIAIINDTVFFGSHNYNLPSTVANDEISFEVESPVLAGRMRGLFSSGVEGNGSLVTAQEIHRARRFTGWERVILKQFLGVF